MNWVREMNTFDGRQVESGEQGVTLFLVFRDFHDELVPDRFEVIKGLCSFLRVIEKLRFVSLVYSVRTFIFAHYLKS